ncbi:MAG: hypothetical protein JSV82_02115 [Planctomycetota bacterium]|nr:MAG: hypothetical protein JSV82_02115 [Planctomycetota bacterium]
MNEYLAIYFFIKLDDIKGCLQQDGGLVFLSLTIMVVILLTLLARADSNRNSFDVACEEVWKRRCARWSVYTFFLTIVFSYVINTFLAFVPSTNQMAAIYLGGQAAQSETVEILSRLPKKYATILESKADAWVDEQVEKGREKIQEAITE